MKTNSISRVQGKVLSICMISLVMLMSVFAHSDSLDSNQQHAHKAKKGFCCVSAPNSLAGKKIVLQVESLQSDRAEMFLSKGAFVQTYTNHRLYHFTTYGQEISQTGEVNYKYSRMGLNEAVERSKDQQGVRMKTMYTFFSDHSGRWKRIYGDDLAVLEGNFIIEDEQENLISDSQENRTNVLNILHSNSAVVPKGGYPGEGAVVLQKYLANSQYEGVAFGPGTVAPKGIYETQKLSNNVVIELAVQTIEELNFVAPYVMVYFYDTPYSGTWYQNFADGLITFSGTFTSFQNP